MLQLNEIRESSYRFFGKSWCYITESLSRMSLDIFMTQKRQHKERLSLLDFRSTEKSGFAGFNGVVLACCSLFGVLTVFSSIATAA
jgi:hypothetical protein